MDKFTLFELHVHDGIEFSAMNTASPFGRSSDDDEEEFEEELEEFLEEMDDDSEEVDDESESGSSGPSGLSLLVGIAFLAGVAFAVRKFRSSDDDLEISELDDFEQEYDEEEAEH